jgi:hypothetical protein
MGPHCRHCGSHWARKPRHQAVHPAGKYKQALICRAWRVSSTGTHNKCRISVRTRLGGSLSGRGISFNAIGALSARLTPPLVKQNNVCAA